MFKKIIFLCVFLIGGFVIPPLEAMPILRNKTPKKNYQEAHEKLYRSIINRQKLTRKKSGWYFLGGVGAVEAIKDYQGKEMKDWIATLNLKTGVQSFFKNTSGSGGFLHGILGQEK